MTSPFLEQLDALLRTGWKTLAPALRDSVQGMIKPFEVSDGGYRGRYGSADRYYTDFAVRLLDLTDAPRADFDGVAAYLNALSTESDLVHLFCQLNAIRMLRERGIELPVPACVEQVLSKQRGEGGGFAHPGRSEPSAYLTFLAALICEMADVPFPAVTRSAVAVRAMRKDNGGFSDRPGVGLAQANTTAAAIAALGIMGALDAQETAQAALFLAGLQTPDGGIRAHREAPAADLLSTFTTLTSLAGMRALDLVRLAPIGRFVLSLRTPEGGFCGSLADPECDLEYTYYGVGSLCLLQAHLSG